jgi:hypothetical protein
MCQLQVAAAGSAYLCVGPTPSNIIDKCALIQYEEFMESKIKKNYNLKKERPLSKSEQNKNLKKFKEF